MRAGVDVHFSCIQCGRCCHDTKIPLSLAEAADWLSDGNQVQIVCEAWSWREDRPNADPKSAYLKRRSFAAMSGSMPARVVATLVASIDGACPNLLPDQRCAIYERRPLVCRIYPAEINPFMKIDPAMKACPPEAWRGDLPQLMRGDEVMNAEMRRDIGTWREALGPEIERKQRVCAALRLTHAAVAHEGFLVHSPPRMALLDAISAAAGDTGPVALCQWRLVTDRADSVERYARAGATISHAGQLYASGFRYIGLKR